MTTGSTITKMSAAALSLLLLVVTCSATNMQLNGSALEKEARLPHDQCGQSLVGEGRPRAKRLTGIYGGSGVRPGELPWMALIGQEEGGQLEYWSAGSLITERYVVTAAHCLLLKHGLRVTKVRLGAIMRKSKGDEKSRLKVVDVESTIVHENFNSIQMVNDIGLIKLKEKVVFTDYIRPICLPSLEVRSKTFYRESLVVAGWGRTEKVTEPISSTLQKVSLPVADQGECKVKLQKVSHQHVVDHRVICVGGVHDRDSCEGDSGGPLMWLGDASSRGVGHRYYLVGVISWGHQCGLAGYPGVYTKVAHFMDWILDHIDL